MNLLTSLRHISLINIDDNRRRKWRFVDSPNTRLAKKRRFCWKILENPKMRNYRKILWWKQQAKHWRFLSTVELLRVLCNVNFDCRLCPSLLYFAMSSMVNPIIINDVDDNEGKLIFLLQALENRKRVTGYEWKIFFWFYRLENKIIFITSLRI